MDGRLIPWEEASVHPSRLGWSTIGAVFEGIKAYWNPEEGELYAWQFMEHYRRFEQSMRLERMRPEFSPEQLVEASCELLRANDARGDMYVRPLAWHADATWFGHHEDSRTGIVITTAPFTSIL
ncbi:MAG TPA: aminotransferase class IV, partial [Chloroflexota bacterium]|nr:aminotransferase class IV [Chloroflexota bacterium]